MDVHCSTCGEPWDTYHLRHDLIFETELGAGEAESWCSLPSAEKLSVRYRNKLQEAGWDFGSTMINVIRCPCCPKGAIGNPDRIQTKSALEKLLGEDEDGLAATFEDYRL
jgi:hypothetical protein